MQNATKHHKLCTLFLHITVFFACGEFFPHYNLSCGEFVNMIICNVNKFLHRTDGIWLTSEKCPEDLILGIKYLCMSGIPGTPSPLLEIILSFYHFQTSPCEAFDLKVPATLLFNQCSSFFGRCSAANLNLWENLLVDGLLAGVSGAVLAHPRLQPSMNKLAKLAKCDRGLFINDFITGGGGGWWAKRWRMMTWWRGGW